MLKGIPAILPPDLLKILMEMGHGDELLLADANYPRLGQPERVIRCDGHGIPELMEAILSLMPLDSYVEHPTTFMAVLPNDPMSRRFGTPTGPSAPIRISISTRSRACGKRPLTSTPFTSGAPKHTRRLSPASAPCMPRHLEKGRCERITTSLGKP